MNFLPEGTLASAQVSAGNYNAALEQAANRQDWATVKTLLRQGAPDKTRVDWDGLAACTLQNQREDVFWLVDTASGHTLSNWAAFKKAGQVRNPEYGHAGGLSAPGGGYISDGYTEILTVPGGTVAIQIDPTIWGLSDDLQEYIDTKGKGPRPTT